MNHNLFFILAFIFKTTQFRGITFKKNKTITYPDMYIPDNKRRTIHNFFKPLHSDRNHSKIQKKNYTRNNHNLPLLHSVQYYAGFITYAPSLTKIRLKCMTLYSLCQLCNTIKNFILTTQ